MNEGASLYYHKDNDHRERKVKDKQERTGGYILTHFSFQFVFIMELIYVIGKIISDKSQDKIIDGKRRIPKSSVVNTENKLKNTVGDVHQEGYSL